MNARIKERAHYRSIESVQAKSTTGRTTEAPGAKSRDFHTRAIYLLIDYPKDQASMHLASYVSSHLRPQAGEKGGGTRAAL